MTMRSRFTAYITKYALTNGIREVQVEDRFDINEGMVKRVDSQLELYHGHDWHRTRAEAVARAEEMRKAKITSLRLSLARVEALKFR